MNTRLRSVALACGLLINLAVVEPVAAAAGTGPTITVTPRSVAPGDTVTVHGTGFAGDCDVLLLWGSRDGALLGTGAVDADGSFTASVRVPVQSNLGSATISAQGRAFGTYGCGEDSASAAMADVNVAGAPLPTTSDTIPLLARKLRAPGRDVATLAQAKQSTRGIHAIIQLRDLPRSGDLETLGALGVIPLAYLNAHDLPGSAYLATITPTVGDGSPEFARLVRAVHPMVPADKIEITFAGQHGPYPRASLVVFFADVSVTDAAEVLGRVGVIATGDGISSTYRANLTRVQVQRLATEDAVQFVAPAPQPGQYDLDNSRALSNVDELQQFDVPSATYLGLSGLGVQISIHDSGVDEHHDDFAGRIIRTNHPGDDGDHGTHVAGIAAGSGAMSNQNDADGNPNGGSAFQWRGMAPQAEIAAYDSLTADDPSVMDDAINDHGVDVSNHSYSYNDGQYDSTMAAIDQIIRGDSPGIPARPVVFSAGNQGTAPQYGMNSGYFSLSKSCKNCIMVANLQDNGVLNGGSSHGPTPDGRLKPDVGANGSGVISTGADVDDGDGGDDTEDSYRSKGGTSMSTPAVTGIVALLLQQYAQQFGVDLDSDPPLPSTVKAILVQTAVDQAGTASGTNPDTGSGTVYGAGPDWGTGYGLVDAAAASQLMADGLFLEDSVAEDDVTDEHLASVIPGQAELRITIAWDDLPGTPNSDHSAPALVNDLDLLLIGPNGEVVRPLVMPAATQFDCDGGTAGIQTGSCAPGADPGPFNTVAAPGTDRLNNVEQVVVANPAPGIWRARVSVLNTDASIRLPMGGTQAYSIAGLSDDRADLRITKTHSPTPGIAGDQLYYTITVTNDGPDTAHDVVVVDVLPGGVGYVTTNLPGGCVEAPPMTLTCDVGDVPSGQWRQFVVKVAVDADLVADNGGPLSIFNTASVMSSTVDDDLSDNTVVEGAIIEDLADLEVTKICKPDRPLLAGELGTCTIFVDNHGPSDARDVRLTDVLLSDQTFTISGVTASQGSCGAPAPISGGQRFTCALGDLAAASASSTGRATIFYEVSSDEAADINDLASAVSDSPDPDTSNNSAQEHLSVTAVADLSITKSGPAAAIAGTDITYDLSITNAGPSVAQNTVIEDVLPAGVTILSVSGSGGATCNAGVPGSASLPTTCSYGPLAVGDSRTMTIEVHVLPDTLGTIHNDARGTSATFDDDLSDNLDTVATAVSGSADLSISKTDSPDPVVAGEALTYTIEVSNAGPSTAFDVSITDAIPAGTSFVSGVDGNGATVCALVQPGIVVCDLGTMAPGTSVVVYVTVLVEPSVPDGSTLTNSVEVSASTPDPDPGDNSTTEDTSVVTRAEIWLDKTGERRSGNPAPVIVFTLTVHNDAGCEADAQSTPTPTCGDGGPSDAQDIVVTDVLPLTAKKVVVQYVSPQCTYTNATHTVQCTADTLPAGATVTFVIEAQANGSVGTILNSASVTTSTTDPFAGNNTDEVTLVVKGGTGKK